MNSVSNKHWKVLTDSQVKSWKRKHEYSTRHLSEIRTFQIFSCNGFPYKLSGFSVDTNHSRQGIVSIHPSIVSIHWSRGWTYIFSLLKIHWDSKSCSKYHPPKVNDTYLCPSTSLDISICLWSISNWPKSSVGCCLEDGSPNVSGT